MRCLGMDTSNYTTSAAVFDGQGGGNAGRLLSVPEGSLGLRQSDALFQHVKRMPSMSSALRENGFFDEPLAAVGASTRPREVEGSYMPCFLAGEGYGRAVADVLKVPFFPFSHQQGHVAAAAWSADHMELLDMPHLAWHLSGGTTELLFVTPDGAAVNATCIGGTTDISAGQLIDRTGKRLGLAFPAGKALDELASHSVKDDHFTVKLKDLQFSLSGVENQMNAMADKDIAPEDIARFILETIASVLLRAKADAEQRWSGIPMLCSGGVASNKLLRKRLDSAIFAQPQYSVDNAMGIAILTHRAMERG
jgi:N6-L-threonylcarbamoyladenine synthase